MKIRNEILNISNADFFSSICFSFFEFHVVCDVSRKIFEINHYTAFIPVALARSRTYGIRFLFPTEALVRYAAFTMSEGVKMGPEELGGSRIGKVAWGSFSVISPEELDVSLSFGIFHMKERGLESLEYCFWPRNEKQSNNLSDKLNIDENEIS